MDSIFDEIAKERFYQVDKWGTVNDDANTFTDWVSYISHHSSRWFPGGYAPYSADTVAAFRNQMIKVAALAVAAVEAVDRKGE